MLVTLTASTFNINAMQARSKRYGERWTNRHAAIEDFSHVMPDRQILLLPHVCIPSIISLPLKEIFAMGSVG